VTTTALDTATLDELSLAITFTTDPADRQAIRDELHTRALELDHHRTTLLNQDETLLGLILDNPTEYLPTATVVTATTLRDELHRRAFLFESKRVDYLASSDGFLGVRLDHGHHDSFLVTSDALRTELHRRAINHGYERDAFLAQTGTHTLGRLLDPATPTSAAYQAEMDALSITATTLRTELHGRALEEDTDRPHLVSERAATLYLAALIHETGMDGEDVVCMDDDDYNDRPSWEVNNARVYRFVRAASRQFDCSGFDLLQTATVTVLGW
jgi:hypothetical protein